LRVGVFGGSFNPPHVGHALVAAWALWTDVVDQVWLLPVFEHAFDKARELAPFDQRVAWCEALASDVDERVRVSTIESTLPTPSYTLHTLEALDQQHEGHRFRLIVGSDILDEVEQWHRWEAILESFAPIIVGRSGYRAVEGCPSFPGVSSTEVRDRLKAGLSVRGLVTASVAEAVNSWPP